MTNDDGKFDYTKVAHREGPSATYLRQRVEELRIKAQIIPDVHEELVDRCDGVSFQRVQEDHDYRQTLLGGVAEDGSYEDNSSARLYREVLGVQFADHDAAVAKATAGGTIDTEVIVKRTPAIAFVESVIEHCESILKRGQEVMTEWSPKDVSLPDPSPPNAGITDLTQYYELIDDPEMFVEQLAEFIGAIQEILPNYDERALFILQLDHTPRYYLEKAYPGLEDPNWYQVHDAEELWEQYQTLLGLEQVFEPDIEGDTKEDDRVQRNYRLYGYRSGSIGAHLLDLYELIWNAFAADHNNNEQDSVREALTIAFPDLTDYREAYITNAVETLEEDENWERPERIDGFYVVNATSEEVAEYKEEHQRREREGYNTFDSIRATTKATYEIDGLVAELTEFDRWAQSTSGNTWTDSTPPQGGDSTLNLPNLLNQLAPTLWLLHPIEYNLDISAEDIELARK